MKTCRAPCAIDVKISAALRGSGALTVLSLLVVLQLLSHENRDAARNHGSSPVFLEAALRVEGHVRGECRIGVKLDLGKSQGSCDALSVSEETFSEPFALLVRSDCDVLDQKVIGHFDQHFDQSQEFSGFFEKIDEMLGNCTLIVGSHWHGFPPYQGHPFGVGGPGQLAYARGVP